MSKFPDLIQHFFNENDITLESPGRPAPARSNLNSPNSNREKVKPNQTLNKGSISSALVIRMREFNAFLSAPIVDLDKIRSMSWSGFPSH